MMKSGQKKVDDKTDVQYGHDVCTSHWDDENVQVVVIELMPDSADVLLDILLEFCMDRILTEEEIRHMRQLSWDLEVILHRVRRGKSPATNLAAHGSRSGGGIDGDNP